jgi:hypothetical protein
VGRLLGAKGLKSQATSSGVVELYTSGDPRALQPMLPILLGEAGKVEKVEWLNDFELR